ncbi:cardiolipin synthase [Halobacillus amylolyticus]|uniref:Cardiolipin synthase n=1 Tax=Halobacillus amylolyticus TaxID=2932259 RepID=A0ABY4H959_9BACI|nr:cardiolipin synthase [Halobacillus amylolyticus]UOR11395.1 cardiolipin synthase [Halobacillus amylolyticus]
MKQMRQVVFVCLLILTFYIIFLSDQPFWIKSLALVAYLLIILSVSYVLMLENRSPYKTLLWIYAIVFFPVIGYIFFVYSGQLQVKGHLFQKKREDNKTYLKDLLQQSPSTYFGKLGKEEQFISNLIKGESHFPLSFSSRTRVLKDGEETFSAMKESLKKAKEFIHMEYYTFRDDKIGTQITDILVEKARSGIEVKVIYDDVGSLKISKDALLRMEEAGVTVACFLPVKYGFFNQKINFRNHRKIIVIDGEAGFVGGLNIGDEYLGLDEKIGFWRDTHLMVEGEVIRSLHAIFLVDWSYLTDERLAQKNYISTPNLENNPGGVQVVASGPDANRGIMGDLYFTMISSAKHSVWIATPYFVPNKDIRTALSMAAKKGVDVKLMVPEISDGFLTQYGTRSYFDELLDKGIDVYMYQKGFMHQKIMIVDGQYASIGTANVDFRSINLNFEVNVFLFQMDSVRQLVSYYELDIKDSEQVNQVLYKNRGLVTKTKESFARLFSPIL